MAATAPSQSALGGPEWLRQRARISPGRLALLCGEERLTFAELDRRVSAVSRGLAAAGVRPGERVALLAGNGAAFVHMVHAVPRLGAVLVPLNIHLTVPELLYQVEDCEPVLLVHDEANEEKAAALSTARLSLSRLSLTGLVQEASRASAPGGDTEDLIDLSALYTIVYTSGTSGAPKGAMLTFGNHWWNALASVLNLGLREDDRWLACLPLFHVGGLAILLRSVIYGIPVVLHESFDAATVNRAIDEDGVTIVSLVPTMLARLLEERGGRPLPAHLRGLLVGGGPLPMSLLEECVRIGWPVAPTYGLTEAASQVATLTPDEALGKMGSAGKPLFPTQVQIGGEGGKEAPPGVPGEILVRGPTVTPGYFRRPRDSAEALRGGWLHTGDIGYLDADGYLHVLDRRDDLIVSGGENVYPAEVEEVLRAHPDVLDAGVTGLPDETWGQMVVAAVILREPARTSEEALLAFCRERLAPYKVPKELRFVTNLPRNAAGKLLRRELRQEWSRNQALST
ncbi:MAG: o-succinylbenzoate--CoA ligase [Dehalococcoidia bacterium]|nr:o-succinylbenzoate--CoA ligase [Dehalococcoidia bacterium]